MEWMIMPLKRYADFQGRSRRMEYWMFALFQVLMVFVLLALFAVLVGFSADMTSEIEQAPVGLIIFVLLVMVYALAMIIPSLAVGVRRWHDQNQSGWLVLLFVVLGFIPIIGGFASIVQLVFMCLPGTKGPNKYGEDPLNTQNLSDVFR
jgi:uncharacterized membrane protein YhaH (DUF805 family)